MAKRAASDTPWDTQVTQGCLDLHDLGLPVEEYFTLIAAGATPSEILDLYRYLSGYDYRLPGIGDHLVNPSRQGLNVYRQGRQAGYSHRSTMAEIASRGISAVGLFFNAIAAGATKGEIRRAHRRGINPRSYAYARATGAKHSDVIAAKKAGLDLHSYGYMRANGANHQSALATASPLAARSARASRSGSVTRARK